MALLISQKQQGEFATDYGLCASFPANLRAHPAAAWPDSMWSALIILRRISDSSNRKKTPWAQRMAPRPVGASRLCKVCCRKPWSAQPCGGTPNSFRPQGSPAVGVKLTTDGSQNSSWVPRIALRTESPAFPTAAQVHQLSGGPE